MRRILLALLLFVGAMPPATAQNTRAGLSILNNTYFTTNGTRSTTGKMVNTWNAALLSSVGFLNGDNTWSGSNSFLSNLYFNGTGYVYSNGPGLPATFTSNPSPVLTTANTWPLTQTFTVNPIFSDCTGFVYGSGASPTTCSTTLSGVAALNAGNATDWIAALRTGWQWGGTPASFAPAVMCEGNMASPAATSAWSFVCGSFSVQSKTQPAGGTPRAVELYVYNNSTAGNTSVWGDYTEAYQMISTGTAYGFEVELVNTYGALTGFWNPFSYPGPGVVANEIGCGAGISSGPPTIYECANALYIAANPAKFRSGLVFFAGSITPTGELSQAISMPSSYSISWWPDSSGSYTSTITGSPYGDVLLYPGLSSGDVKVQRGRLSVAGGPAYSTIVSPATATVANGSSYALPCTRCVVMVSDTTTGGTAMYNVQVGTVNMIFTDGSAEFVASTTTPAAGKISVAWSGSADAIYNNKGSALTFSTIQLAFQ